MSPWLSSRYASLRGLPAVVLLVGFPGMFASLPAGAVCTAGEWERSPVACVREIQEMLGIATPGPPALDEPELVEAPPEPEEDPVTSAPDSDPPVNDDRPPAPKPIISDKPLGSPIVYSRVPRTHDTTVMINGKPEEVRHLDVWDALPEVGFQFSGFSAPGQLVLRQPNGEETIIYDCHTNWQPCVPFDASVSLDGKRIAFALYRSDELRHRNLRANEKLPNWYLSAKGREAQIFIYDIERGELTPWRHKAGVHDTSPIWLPDGRMMFASNRHNSREPWIPRAAQNGRVPSHLYIAQADGSDVQPISPHELGGALHPWLLNSGRVAYSSKWLSHNLPFVGTNGAFNWFTTLENMWVLSDMDVTGGDMTALLGSHRNLIKASDGRIKNMKALHFIGQRSNDDICIANYYRANNLGLGDVWCFTPEPKHLEGPAPRFLPSNTYNVADWSKSNDEANWKPNRAKAGFPEGTPDGQLLLTVGQGWCTTVAYGLSSTPGKIDRSEQTKGCDAGLYKTTRIPSKSVSDIQLVVDSPDWHEFNARVVASREVASPSLSRSGSNACLLASSDAGSTDAHHYGGFKFNKMYKAMANNGGEIHGLSHEELDAIRFYQVVPNRGGRVSNVTGNNLRFLADVPLLADKSFVAEVPCNTSLLMAGVDGEGRIIKRDQVPMSLRPGEKRVCTGCHLHGSEGRPYEESLASRVSPIRLPKSRAVPTWSKQVEPLLRRNCAGCHADDFLMGYDSLTYDPEQNHALSVAVVSPDEQFWSRKKGLQRPATSKYINSMFARESLLYWVARGERTDGRTNEQYEDDIDYPESHPTVKLKPAEIALIARWIDGGYPE